MNASEARKLSNDNVPKLIEKNFKEVVSKLNEMIKSAAEMGDFTTGVPISMKWDHMEKVIDKLKQHYLDEGYEVNVHNLHITKMFFISWKK